MFTDTHCHISMEDYDNIEKIINSAKEYGIDKLINNGTNAKNNFEVLALSKKYEGVYAAIGIHPEEVGKYKEEDIEFIEHHIDEIVAIGEIGLDYHYESYDRKREIELFERQLKIAEKYNKPVIVHSRDATEDTIAVLKKYPKVRGSIHCFTGSLETAKIYIKMGYKIGFGGVTTFKNAKIKTILSEIPDNAILLETDSPYLSPEPVRGTKNEPKNIYHIAKFIADYKGVTVEYLSKITESNVRSLFDI